MPNQILSNLELKLKKIAILSQMYADDKAASNALTLTSATSSEYLKTYTLTQGVGVSARTVGTIDIPKDYLVTATHTIVVTGETGNLVPVKVDGENPPSGYVLPSAITSAGTWLDLVINVKEGTSNESHVCVKMDELIDEYTDGSGITVNNRTVQLNVVEGGGIEFDASGATQLDVDTAHGLQVDSNSGLTFILAQRPISGETVGNDGAMSAQDKKQIINSNNDLLVDEEMASWFGYPSNSQRTDQLSGVSREPYDVHN